MSVCAALNICRINSAFSAKRARCSELILFFSPGTVTTYAETCAAAKPLEKANAPKTSALFTNFRIRPPSGNSSCSPRYWEAPSSLSSNCRLCPSSASQNPLGGRHATRNGERTIATTPRQRMKLPKRHPYASPRSAVHAIYIPLLRATGLIVVSPLQKLGECVSDPLAKHWMRQRKTAIVASGAVSACHNLAIRGQRSAPR